MKSPNKGECDTLEKEDGDGDGGREGEGEGDGEGEKGAAAALVSATAVNAVPPIEQATPAIFHQLNFSCPVRTAIANVNMPEVALTTVLEVTDVSAREMLYRPLAINQSGMTMIAARSVGQWYIPLM